MALLCEAVLRVRETACGASDGAATGPARVIVCCWLVLVPCRRDVRGVFGDKLPVATCADAVECSAA